MSKSKTCKCSECEHCKITGSLRGSRSSCYCNHPNREYIQKYYNEHKIHRAFGFIDFSEKFKHYPKIKTSPKWCPKKAGDNNEID